MRKCQTRLNVIYLLIHITFHKVTTEDKFIFYNSVEDAQVIATEKRNKDTTVFTLIADN